MTFINIFVVFITFIFTSIRLISTNCKLLRDSEAYIIECSKFWKCNEASIIIIIASLQIITYDETIIYILLSS